MRKIEISNIQKGSIADELGIKAGDFLVSINGKTVKDVFDYRFFCADSELTLGIENKEGEIWEFEIEKDESEDLGLEFKNSLLDEEKSCRNKCVFCFIDQLPRGMRDSLYFKDDDARLSFLFGNYITMTNISDDEIDRIIRYRMSPVNVSVHTTNPELRRKMLNNRFAGDILEKIKRFTDSGITVNAQIVLCPDINDKDELNRTLADLTPLYPELHSISVVPVGLTRYREGLAHLKPFERETAADVIDQVEGWQKKLLKKYKSRIVYIADELYILAERELPLYKDYEDFPQIENGVGMVASFKFEVEEALEEYRETEPFKGEKVVSIATGTSVYAHMKQITEIIENAIDGLKIQVFPIENNFFGRTVTVTGLITGRDLIAGLTGKKLGKGLLLSQNMFRAGTHTMLDDVTKEQLEKELGVAVQIVDTDGRAFLDALVQF